MPFQIIRNDITKVHADAIVNTANPEPVFAAGTDSAVYHAAGADVLLEERKKIGEMQVGEVNVTDAYALNARYIIHTVGPVWIDGRHGELEALASCYRKSLHLAEKLECRSIAFPLISTGVYGFPKDKALDTALAVIRHFLETSDMEVTLVVFSRKAYQLSEGLVASVRQYIDDNYCRDARETEYGSGFPEEEEERPASSGIRNRPSLRDRLRWARRQQEDRRKEREAFREEWEDLSWEKSVQSPDWDRPAGDIDLEGAPLSSENISMTPSAAPEMAPAKKMEAPKVSWESVFGKPSGPAGKKKTIQDVIDQAGEGFQEMLLRLIDEKGMKGPDVYKRANIDKKLFSKIKTNPSYVPKKQTAVALAVALKLNLDETTDLLNRAGLALSPSNYFDLIVSYCIENKNYDIFEINAVLFEYDQPLLGSQ